LYFWYGPDFFDGNSRNLRDRQGFIVNGSFDPYPALRLRSAGGRIWDNLGDDRDETLSVDVVNVELSTSIIPRTTLTTAYDRIAPDWDEAPHDLFSFGLRSSFIRGWGVSGYYSFGDDLRLNENDGFLDGLRLPGISRFDSEKITASIQKRLSWGSNLALSYLKSGDIERPTAVYTDTFNWPVPIDTRTEVGYDLNRESYYFESRLETAIGKGSRSRFGFLARAEDDEWRVEIYINLSELFTFLGGRPRHVTKREINPEGKIVCGKVFLDQNANAILDPGEPGLEEITVLMDNRRKVTTNEDGNFFISTSSVGGKGLVNLDPKSIPAIYSCTHGKQTVNIVDGEITRVNFGLMPIHYVSGKVLLKNGGEELLPVAGVRVYVTPIDDDKQVAESVTGSDGAYYLQDIKPGKYALLVDPKSVPADFDIKETKRPFEVVPSEESQEINPADIIAIPAGV
jgi:hypothetical protein